MAYKSAQFNLIISDFIELMDDDTLLLIASDHGQTQDGMHGGDLPEETGSFLFGYTKRGFKDEVFDPKYKNLMARTRNEVLTQNSIAPTLSWLTGSSPPFINLGSLINDFHVKGKERE